jgi:aspartate/methionine/tyrosine aminotransferase
MPRLNPLYAQMPTTIFEAMSGLRGSMAQSTWARAFLMVRPPALAQAATRAMAERSQQYPPMAGVPELRDAVAAFYARRQGLNLSREHVIVTSGATEAVAAAILATVQPGDEVLVLAPAYDAYAPLVRRAGGVPVFVALTPPDWAMPLAALRAALTPRTRVLILNDPLNPTGTVTTPAERAALAALCVEADLVAICDEVWKWSASMASPMPR